MDTSPEILLATNIWFGSTSVFVIDGVTDTLLPSIDLGVGGEQPLGVGVNPVTNKIYVSTQSDRLFEIDGTNNNVLGTQIIGAGDPLGIAVNTVTNKVYVAAPSASTVTVMDGATFTKDATVSGFSFNAYLDVNTVTNKVYVSNITPDTVTVLDGSTNLILTTIPVGTNPLGVAVNSDTNQIFVANNISGDVSIIDGDTDTVIATIDTQCGPGTNGPQTVGVNSITNKAYVSNTACGTISVISPTLEGGSFGSVAIVAGQLEYSHDGSETTSDSFDYTITDGEFTDTATVFVDITPVNDPPVASAFAPFNVVVEQAIVPLDGSFSFDPEGDPLTFLWTQTSGITATISDATTSKATFIAPRVTTTQVLEFNLDR